MVKSVKKKIAKLILSTQNKKNTLRIIVKGYQRVTLCQFQLSLGVSVDADNLDILIPSPG